VSENNRDPASGRPIDPRQKTPGDVLLVLRIVHAALMASVLLFGVMLIMVTRPPGDPVPGADIPVRAEPPAVIAPIMAGLALVTLCAVVLVRRRMSSERADAPIPQARIYSLSITSWALTESIGMYGLVLGILHRDPLMYVPFGGVSLLVLLLLAPRRSHIQRE
jgi:F0F1-type ATP synthase membrane subunit c/vacuolar-type H+-ATPase subunit K